MTSPELVAVMPVFNEEANIANSIKEWLETFNRGGISCLLVAINDGSTDNSGNILERLQSRFPTQLVVCNQGNSGHGRACRVGYETAVRLGSHWVLQIDSDGQCDPAFFQSFWDKRENADCIFGLRTKRGDGCSRRIVSVLLRLLLAGITGRDLKDANVPYRLIERSALQKALQNVPREFDLQNIALTLALKRDKSLRWVYIPIRFPEPAGRKRRMNVWEIGRRGIEMLWKIHTVRTQG